MKLDFVGSRWFQPLMIIILPILLLLLAMVLNADICYFFLILLWIGMGLILLYLPKAKD
ncbi:MAG: hypothetical protein A4E31_01152 [Methanomassiliicoccales archaeon PtaU1.Bin030]|nr:MAG: hypothetical protein A4E31_01152 [Methanomassiliicoccales archaeon PtaU1.Bin030]